MTTYRIKGPVLGELGDGTQLDTSVHPPIVTNLHYVFDSYDEEDLVSSFPVTVVRRRLREAIEAAGLTGVTFGPVVVAEADQFDILSPGVDLPNDWDRLEPTGTAGVDDVWRGERYRLTCNERAWQVLSQFNLADATIDELG